MTTTHDPRHLTPTQSPPGDTQPTTPDTHAVPAGGHPTPDRSDLADLDKALIGTQFDIHVDLGWLDKALTRGDLMTWQHVTETWLLTLAQYGVYGLRLIRHLDRLVALHGVPDDMPYWLRTFIQDWAREAHTAPATETGQEA